MLRQTICNYLETNPMLIDDMRAEDVVKYEKGVALPVYVASMRSPMTMGGATEIRAFTKMFKINVRIKSVPNRKIIEFVEDPSFPWCTIIWTGGHFDPCLNQLI